MPDEHLQVPKSPEAWEPYHKASLAAFDASHGDFRPIALSDLIPRGDAALAALIDKAPGHALRLSPASTGTDGFFFAAYERAA